MQAKLVSIIFMKFSPPDRARGGEAKQGDPSTKGKLADKRPCRNMNAQGLVANYSDLRRSFDQSLPSKLCPRSTFSRASIKKSFHKGSRLSSPGTRPQFQLIMTKQRGHVCALLNLSLQCGSLPDFLCATFIQKASV